MLPLDQRTVIEQTNFAYSPLGKAFEKQIKNNWRSRKKTNKGIWKAQETTRKTKIYFGRTW